MKYLIFILFPVLIYSQDSTSLQTLQRRTQELVDKISSMPINLFWDSDTTGLVDRYMIFYIQGEDTLKFASMFGFVNGASFAQVEPWWIGNSLYDYFYVSIKDFPGTYVRLGIIPIMSDGTTGTLKCISGVIPVNSKVRSFRVKL